MEDGRIFDKSVAIFNHKLITDAFNGLFKAVLWKELSSHYFSTSVDGIDMIDSSITQLVQRCSNNLIDLQSWTCDDSAFALVSAISYRFVRYLQGFVSPNCFRKMCNSYVEIDT